MKPEIVIPFASIDLNDSPNMRKRKSEHPSAAYYRAMIVCFASIRRWDLSAKLSLITNAPTPKPFSIRLKELDVVEIVIKFEHVPPEQFSARFLTSLFFLDALKFMSTKNRQTIFLDPDMVFVRSPSELFAATSERLSALEMNYPKNHNVNGLSREEAGAIHFELHDRSNYSDLSGPARYFGGEIYVIPGPQLAEVYIKSENAWQFSLDRFKCGSPYFRTEEHIMNYVFAGREVYDLGSWVKRIWTTARYRNITGEEAGLTIWHLPAEKGRGFDVLYRECFRNAGWFWKTDDKAFLHRVERIMGVRRRRVSRWLRDVAGRVLQQLRVLATSRS